MSARLASAAALVCFLCASIQLVQVHADCNGQEADIQLLLNCTTQNPKAQLLFGPSPQDSWGLLDLEFNCSYGSMVSTGHLLQQDAYDGSSSLQTPSISQSIPWGAQCVFSGCYMILNFLADSDMFSIPPSACTLHNPADVGCAVNCSDYSVCVDSRCECMEGLLAADEGQSCFNLTDCRHGNGLCYKCTENGTCGCRKGFEPPVEVDYGLLSCRDINECSVNNGGCEQECVNTISSFLCACSHGYVQLENGTCRRNSVTTTQLETGMVVLWILLLIPVVTILLVVGVVVGVLFVLKRKRMELHRFEPRMAQKLVDDLLIDITATTFVEADDESILDYFLPSPVYSWSSMPELVDDIHRVLGHARKFSSPDDGRQHVSAPDLAKKMYTLPAVTHSSMPALRCSSQQFNTPLSRVPLSDPRNVTQLILDLPNQEDQYIVLSDVSQICEEQFL